MTLPDEVLELLEQPVFVFVATTLPSGQPHNTPVWITVVDGRPLFNTAVGRVKERNLRRDPRLSLSFLTPEDPEEYVELRGTAEFSLDGADDMIDALSRKYVGTDFAHHSPSQQRINVFVDVDRVSRG
jgi:PPOX class probable F420-dependent enzyme